MNLGTCAHTGTERVVNTLTSGKVLRYHAAPTVQPQNVAHHAWGVAVLVHYITRGQASAALLMEALLHDSGELFTGDVPFTVKRDSPSLKFAFDLLERNAREAKTTSSPAQLDTRELAILKVCDTLEGFIWCVLHEHLGPVCVRWVDAFARGRVKFKDDLHPAEWERANEIFHWYYESKYAK